MSKLTNEESMQNMKILKKLNEIHAKLSNMTKFRNEENKENYKTRYMQNYRIRNKENIPKS